jgi:hypothetical protein
LVRGTQTEASRRLKQGRRNQQRQPRILLVRRPTLRRLYQASKQASNQRTTNKAINILTTASMSISYEEALATLQSMFGETWSREDLDTVLRHKQGQ